MKTIYSAFLMFTIASCAGTQYCYVVRHAEKLDNTPYSVLSKEGHQRAAALRDSLINKKIEVIFVTSFVRTQETAQPLATAMNKPFSIYRNNAVDSIVSVIRKIKNKNILLVGHSGNIPSIIEGLTGNKVNSIKENEYDHLFVIKTRKGKTQLFQKKYGN